MSLPMLVVTGAPGAGKSQTVQALLNEEHPYMVLDIDWIIDEASHLAGKDIHFEPDTWKPYGQLWNAILDSIMRNSKTVILFTPNSRDDLLAYGLPALASELHMMLIDCSDDMRVARLRERPVWSEKSIRDALDDANELRASVTTQIDSGDLSPNEVARHVLRWADSIVTGN